LRSGGGYEAVHGGEPELVDEMEFALSTGSIRGEATGAISVALARGVRTIRVWRGLGRGDREVTRSLVAGGVFRFRMLFLHGDLAV